MLIDQQHLRIPIVFNQKLPGEGPKTIPLVLNFGLASTYELTGELLVSLGHISNVQTIYCNAMAAASNITITCAISGQVIEVIAGTQGYYNVLAPNPLGFTFACSDTALVLKLFLLNVPIPGMVWPSVGSSATAYNLAQDEGATVGAGNTTLDFIGAGVTVTDAGGGVTAVTIPGGGITQAYTRVQDEGSNLTQRSTINFVGAGVTAADAGGVTEVTIPGGGGGGGGFTTKNIVTGSRSCGTVFTNSGPTTMFVSALVTSTFQTFFLGETDAANPPTAIVSVGDMFSPSSTVTIQFMVLPGDNYRVVCGAGTPSVFSWTEWS